MFTLEDQLQLQEHGITADAAALQIETFKKGFPFLEVTEPAVVSNGIMRLECDEVDDLIDIYRSFEGNVYKFVPASGAATRMFKDLFEALDLKAATLSEVKSRHIVRFFETLQKYPFYGILAKELWDNGYRIEQLEKRGDYKTILEFLLSEKGLAYGTSPKGILLFHKYTDELIRTAFEEHLAEGAQYCKGRGGEVNIHFTISPEHQQRFTQLFNGVKEQYEKEFDVTFNVSFSFQHKNTDTIAVDLENAPFRNPDGTLLFRPGGHGALIQNLNDIDTDIIFIKNIDNVVPDRLKPTTVRYKKALAGLLLSYQHIVFDYLRKLTSNDNPESEFLLEILDFVVDELCVIPPSAVNLANPQQLKAYLVEKLNRPIRVCGMVKNEGEPGGGPFWAVNADGSVSLQIVESSQIDLNNEVKKAVFDAATHFNPVDLVCAVKDYNGNKFDLTRFTDPNTGFISTKSKDGKNLKALELPGLWNGAMSNWITIFAEVPLSTFNPVKTVYDLLRDEHMA